MLAMRLLVVAAVLVTGCASITASRTEPFSVTSSPPGADVTLNGSFVGRTPVTLELPRRLSSPAVVVSLAGHEPRTCAVSHSVGGGYVAANSLMCLFLFPIGCVSFVDGNGSWNELVTDQCSVAFVPAAPRPVAGPAQLKLCSRSQDCAQGFECNSYRCEQRTASAAP